MSVLIITSWLEIVIMVYKSEKYKRKILNITDSLVESMNLGGKEHLIETSFGKSYCYEIPNSGKPKMIIMPVGSQIMP